MKILLFTFSIIFTVLAFAQGHELDVVFDLKYSLLQQVPASNLAFLDKTKIITADSKYYRVADKAAEVLERLSIDPRIKMYVVSDLTAEAIASILNQVPLASNSQLALSTLFAGMADYSKMAAWSLDPDNTLILSNKLNDQQFNGTVVQNIPTNYYFETVAQAKESWAKYSANHSGSQQWFPLDQETLDQNHDRMLGVLHLVRNIAKKTAANVPLQTATDVEIHNKFADEIRTGKTDLLKKYRWQTRAGQLLGCAETSNDPKVPGASVDMQVCVKTLPTHINWKLHGTADAECIQWTEDNLQIATLPEKSCLEKLQTYAIWSDVENNQCGLYTEKFQFLKKTDNDDCALNINAKGGKLQSFTFDKASHRYTFKELTQPLKYIQQESCSQPAAALGADDSTEVAYFKALLAKGAAAPIEDFLHLWYPHGRTPSDQTSIPTDENDFLVRCQHTPYGQFTWVVDGGVQKLADECKPDALYSWGPAEKTAELQQVLADSKDWSAVKGLNPHGEYGKDIFSTISAVSTFEYGEYVLRFKIKHATPFVSSGFQASAGTVGVRFETYRDWAFNSGDVIDSWSFGTPEIYDEVVRDIQRISSQSVSNVYTSVPRGTGIERLINTSNGIDSHSGNPEDLKVRLLNLIKQILNHEGHVIYSAGACRNRIQEYSTTNPSYINPYFRKSNHATETDANGQ